MAQEAHEAPVGRSRSSSSTSPATGMRESPRQMQAHTPCFPSWIPSYAGTFAAGAGLAAAPSLPSEHVDRGNFLSLLGAKNVTPEMFEDVPAAACDYLELGGVGAAASNMAGPAAAAAAAAFGLGSVDPYSTSSAPPVKHETAASSPSPLVYSGDSDVVHGSSMGCCMPCYDHEGKPADDSQRQRQGFGAPTAAFLQQTVPSRVELQSVVLGYSGMLSERLEPSSFGVGSLPDDGSFSDYNTNRSSADFMSSNSNRQEQDIRQAVSFDFLAGLVQPPYILLPCTKVKSVEFRAYLILAGDGQ